MEAREAIKKARRIVVKIGSASVIAGEGERFGIVADQLAALRAAGHEVVLISSGAVALGLPRLGMTERPDEVAKLQAAAATGQSRLMHAYEEAFAGHGVEVAQLLLTHTGLSDRERFLNARAAIDALIEHGCVPIVNENDTVAVEEIRFGDNDQLAATVAALCGADLLVLLTNVSGLLDGDGERISIVEDVDSVLGLAKAVTSSVSRGGMRSKLDAARRASLRGLPVVIADASVADVVQQIVAGHDVGTLVLPHGSPLASRKHWIAYTLKPEGVLQLDAGAIKALRETGCSLLPAGIAEIEGSFGIGDAVSLVGPDGAEFARGLARYAADDMRRVAGRRAHEIEGLLGYKTGEVMVHRDDLVLL